MTTIAWDGKTLAADRRVSYDSVSDANTTKIVKTDNGLCGAAGNTSIGAAFKRWFVHGEEGDPPPLEKNGQEASAFIIREAGVRLHYDQFGWFQADPGPFAIGSGWEIAIGAMKSGKSAAEAVQIAAKLDGYTGSDIDVLEL